MNLRKDIQAYWNHRDEGYSAVNEKELANETKTNWQRELGFLLPENRQISILDIGCGPGFFPILLKEMGYGQVRGLDYSPKMVAKAQSNAKKYLGLDHGLDFVQMDAQKLELADCSVDLILSRNLLWNLEEPDKAYDEWLRVLKPGGKILIFDANWYAHLSNEKAQEQFVENRQILAEENLEDYWQGGGIDEAAMEAIVSQLPLTRQKRPVWDQDYLRKHHPNLSVQVDLDFGSKVWVEEERLNYGATPLFKIEIVKDVNDD